jgi:hypothetical protein
MKRREKVRKMLGGGRMKFQLVSLFVVFGLLLFNTGPVYARHQASSSGDQTNNDSKSEPLQPQPSPSSEPSGLLSSHHSESKGTDNVTNNVIDCFENNASNIENQFITEIARNLNNISAMQNGTPFNKNHTELAALNQALVDCFIAANKHHNAAIIHRTINPIQTEPGLGTFLTPGQLTVTGVKHPPPKHSAAYNIGYKLGTADGKRGGAGLPDGSGACNSGIGVNGTAATNQCLVGYFTAWNKYCPTSKYDCNS